jgi:hypothetical protein
MAQKCKACGTRTQASAGFCQRCKSLRHRGYKRVKDESLVVDQIGGAWWIWDARGNVLVEARPTRDAAIISLGAREDDVDAEEPGAHSTKKSAARLDREVAAALKSVAAKKLFAWRPKLEETIADVDEGRVSRSQDQPLRVSRLDAPRGAYLILDGHHRAVEAIRAGHQTIPVEIDRYLPRIEHAGGAFDSYVNDKTNVYARVVRGS